jgi:hypothetical protein
MRLNDVNTTDLTDAIRLGCRMMCNVFNADDGDIPFFGSEVRPNPQFGFSGAHTESHVPGRHLNALLNAEDAAGIAVPADAIDKHANAAFFSYGGPLALPLNRSRIGGPLELFTTHNVREGFHALYPLVKYRGSERARELAERSIRELAELFRPDTGWDLDRLQRCGLTVREDTFITGIARAIGPLVKYYRATGHGPALELAVTLADKTTGEFFLESGAYDRERFGAHTHSTTCVMSSLAQLADLLDDARLLARVRAFYDNGLWEIRDEIGWVIESSRDDAVADRGEINNTGDIVETALILGRRGFPEYFEDAERIVRCHILPSQLRDNSFIEDPPNPDGADYLHRIADRHLGGFGFPAPYGHEPLDPHRDISFNTDIVGGGVGSLCEVVRESVRTEHGIHRVNLLFDRETDHISVESPYTHDRLRVTVRTAGPLYVRMPSWVEPPDVAVEPDATRVTWSGGYLLIAEPPVGRAIDIRFPLAEREIVLHHRTRDIRVRLRGDAVAAMENHGADLTYFDPL